MTRDELHARARAFVTAFERGEPPPESFDALGSDLVRYQAVAMPGYARLCAARGVVPGAVSRLEDAPPVPTDAFKLTRVAAFPEAETSITFRTSGTTVGRRGEHAFRHTATYDAGAVAFGRWALASDLEQRVPVVVIGPSPEEAPDSSLTHMIAAFVATFGVPASTPETYFVVDGVLDLDALDQRIATATVSGDGAILVLGTSFAFVHLLDAIDDAPFPLPPRSRVMHTGGYKGKSRELSKEELREALSVAFAIPQRSVVNEYGMTELSSQFYEATQRDPDAPEFVLREPPWARVVPVDPITLAPVAEGEIGIARIDDLMNVESAVSVLTQDRVRRIASGGFELLGRAEGAPPRGCSLATEELLGERPTKGGERPE